MKHPWFGVTQINDPNLRRNKLEYLVAFPKRKRQFEYCVDEMGFAFKPTHVPPPRPDVRTIGDFQGLKYFQNTSLVWPKA